MPTINRNTIKQPKQHYKHNNVSAEYYGTVMWKNLRNSYIKENPFCEYCLKEYNRVRLADEVHHIKEFLSGKTEEERMELLLDRDNLMSVCRDCHLEIHNARRKNKKLNPPGDQKEN